MGPFGSQAGSEDPPLPLTMRLHTQICLKGKLHIFKYLSTEAGRRGGSALGDLAPSRPPSFSPW